MSAATSPLDSTLLTTSLDDGVFHIRLTRSAKRNALNDALVAALHTAFVYLPKEARAAVISGEGDHFCAGLDLSELGERTAAEGVVHSRSWHAAFEQIQFARVPVVSALHGAVVGGGLEMASATHIRVADATAYFALPEGTRGLFVGGGGSARITRLIGCARMTDMMLTGRIYQALEAEQVGLVQYLVDAGEAVNRALALAHRIAQNAPLSNFAIVNALPRIADQSQEHGLFTEALMAGIAQSDPEAKDRMRAFLDKRAGKVGQ